MTMSPVLALREAVRATLLGNASLVAALGGPRVFDEPPRASVPPYVAFGDVNVRDWSTSGYPGTEQACILNVWSSQPGAHEALVLVAQISALLDGAALTLTDHHLVNMRLVSIETRREGNGRLARASLRLRAVTEPL